MIHHRKPHVWAKHLLNCHAHMNTNELTYIQSNPRQNNLTGQLDLHHWTISKSSRNYNFVWANWCNFILIDSAVTVSDEWYIDRLICWSVLPPLPKQISINIIYTFIIRYVLCNKWINRYLYCIFLTCFNQKSINHNQFLIKKQSLAPNSKPPTQTTSFI